MAYTTLFASILKREYSLHLSKFARLSILLVFISFPFSVYGQEELNIPDLDSLQLDEVGSEKQNKQKTKNTLSKKRKKKKKARKSKKAKRKSQKDFEEIYAGNIDSITINKTNEIIRKMKTSDPGTENYLNIRLGAIQILSNTTGLETSADKTLLSTGLDLNFRIWGNVYFESHYAKHTNTLTPANLSTDATISLKNLYQESTDVGLKYRIILDETKPSNYLGFKLMAHNTTNNFYVADPTAAIIITQYDGFVLGVEKGIPITSNLGIDASLDMISITKIKEVSDFNVKNTGVGFVVRGEVYYALKIGKQKLRLAMAYWQSGMVNEFTAADRELFDRQNQVQTYRMISGSIGAVF